MREIKFRAWHKKDKYMFNTVVLFSTGFRRIGKCQIVSNGVPEVEFISEADFEIMQYTGLKDRNGKEIYEGDIVRETCQDYPSGSFEEVWKVEELMEFYHRLDPIVGFGRNELEIIGNIYQNQDLLKTK